jgi:4'-phosphopantetheinyl transferase
MLRLDPVDVPLHRDDRGCPRLDGCDAHTSLSHTRGAVAVAFSDSGAVGIDIEPAGQAAVMPEIDVRVGHPNELKALADMDGHARARDLLALWVRKEAALKAAGIGMEMEMDCFQAPDGGLVRLPDRPGVIEVRMLDVGADWAVAVAGPPKVDVEHGWIRPEAFASPDPQPAPRPAMERGAL